MATSIGCLETSDNNMLTCDVCFKEFTEPKLLSCLHSFCAGCLTNLLQDNLITCPTCHVQTQVTEIKALPSNIFLSSVLSSGHFKSNCSEESKVCSACDDEGLKSVCQECRYFLCDFCTQAHRKQKSTRNHQTVTIEEFRSSTPASCSMFISMNCEKHDGEVIKMFCSSCEETLCRDCVIVNHRDHSVQEIKSAFEKVKPELNGLVQKADDVGKMLEQAVASVHQMENNVRSTADSQIDKVNDVFEEVVKHIYKRKQELIDSILVRKSSKLKVLNTQVKGFRSDLASVKHASTFTKETLERNNSYEVLTLQKSLKRRLFKLVEEERDFHLRENDDIVFRENNIPQILRLINEMGAVTATACVTKCVVEEMAKVVDLVDSLECSQTFKVVVYDKKGFPVSWGGMSDDLSVQVTRCETKENIPVTVHDNLDGSYTVTYQLLVPGQYQIEVMLGADHIKGSPFQLTARNGKKPDPNLCKLSSRNQHEIILIGESIKLEFLLEVFTEDGMKKETGGDPIEMTVGRTDVETSTWSKEESTRMNVVDNGDGTYDLSCDIIHPGLYQVFLNMNKKRHSFLRKQSLVYVKNGREACPQKCITKGLENLNSSAFSPFYVQVIEKSFQIEVFTEDGKAKEVGDDNLSVIAESTWSSRCDVDVDVNDHGNGTYTATLKYSNADDYVITVLVNTQHIKNSPFQIPLR